MQKEHVSGSVTVSMSRDSCHKFEAFFRAQEAIPEAPKWMFWKKNDDKVWEATPVSDTECHVVWRTKGATFHS